jgi:tRNA threonylcarbamoyladenosine biosynthesis protein TsaE
VSVVAETGSAAETEALAARIAQRARGGETLLLVGELGAGKTCFVRGLARGLGIDPRAVKSPTYNVLHQYAGGRLALDHFDAYFVREEEEFARVGLEEFLRAGHLVAVEWGDRFRAAFDPDALTVRLEVTGEKRRRIACDASGAASRRLLAP